MDLKRHAVTVELLEGLYVLMADPRLKAFVLAGGTSLALRFAHRKSVDIDLFAGEDFDSRQLADDMARRHQLQRVEMEPNTVRGLLYGVKLDMIAHVYPCLRAVDMIDGIRMASLQDVAAMKLNAISNRGSKKDFWDYALLLEYFRHGEMLDFFSQKYTMLNRWHVEKSVFYFDDAELEPDPIDLVGQTWENVKRKIVACCRQG